MSGQEDAFVYNINKDYRVVGVRGNKCSLFFKNNQNQLIASLNGCQNIFTEITLSGGRQALTDIEKKYLLSFIRAKKYLISKETAEMLDVSIIRHQDGREEYLSERQLKRRIAYGIDFAKVYIGKLSASVIKIPADSRETSYHFGSADVKKLLIGENCSINIDLRDNTSIENIIVNEKFSGAMNLSRTAVESIFIGNNCRCNLSISDSKRCFNLQIADIYSGNLNISNSCLYALGIGYYSYADIMLTNNIIKKEISIGDSFRGGIYAAEQSVETIKIGDDCKGWIKLAGQGKNIGTKKVSLGDDFSGTLNMSGDDSISSLEFGRKNTGKTEASYMGNLQTVKTGKFYSGTIDLTTSAVKNISVAYGASGKLNIEGCKNLTFVQATIDNHLVMKGCVSVTDAKTVDGNIYYNFGKDTNINNFMPFYKRIYTNTRKMLSGRFM